MKLFLSGSSLYLLCCLKKNISALILPLFFLCLQPGSLYAQTSSLLTCPADITQINDSGMCTARVTFPMANDVISAGYTITYSYNSGAPFPVGTTKVVKQLLDQNGTPLSSCSFNVIVLDKDAPVITNCPGNVLASAGKDSCGTRVSFSNPTVYDRCTSQRKTFYYTGAPQIFVVPTGVTSINVDVTGASGGHTFYNNSVYGYPGLGGKVSATIAVTPGQMLTINVGGAGSDGTQNRGGVGGFNGGGNGTAVPDSNSIVVFAAGGGGGASDIRTGDSLVDRIVVAGGGGAAGINQAGGNGGGLVGQNAAVGTSTSTAANIPATGGSQTQGGNGGSYQNGYFATNGSLGHGGNGSSELTGAGGGAGFYGGGGGSFGSGAGGSSYTFGGATNVNHIQGAQQGNGSVSLSYNQPPALAQTAGMASGSLFPVGETINTFTATDAAGNTSTCTFKVTVSDNQKPTITVPAVQNFIPAPGSYTIPSLVATDNCAISSVTYSVTGATTRSGTGYDASGNFNPGTSVVNYTVTDIHGNTQSASTTVYVTAISSLTVAIPDVYAVTPGGNPNTIYKGYGPSNITLKAIVDGGKSPYTYSWISSDNSTLIGTDYTLPVSSPGEYTVTVTDATGATAVIKKQVYVVDVRCGKDNEKVIVCKASKGNKKLQSSCIKEDEVAAELAKGGSLGYCLQSTSSARMSTVSGPEVVVKNVVSRLNVYPNPAHSQVTVQLNRFTGAKAEVLLLSASGMAVQRRTVELKGTSQSIILNTSNLARGTYLVKVISDEGIQTANVVIQN